MKLNTILNTYFNPKGTISAHSYLVGIALAAILLLLSNIEGFSLRLAGLFEETANEGGLLGLLSEFSKGELYMKANKGIFIFISHSFLLIPATYMVACITYKRYISLSYPKSKAYPLLIVLCLVYFFFNISIYQSLSFLYQLSLSSEWITILSILICILVLLPAVFIVYLISRKKIPEDEAPKAAMKPVLFLLLLFGICFIRRLLLYAIDFKWVDFTLLLMLFTTYTVLLSRIVRAKSTKIWTIYGIFMLAEALHMVLVVYSNNTWLLAIANNIVYFIEKAVYWLSPVLIFSLAIYKNDSGYKPLFSNTILNNIFDFRGTLSSRAYKAALILIMVFFNLQQIPILQSYIKTLNFSVFSYSNSIFGIFYTMYSFITIYAIFAVNIKRVRAKSLPISIGWITGAIMSLALVGINILWQLQYLYRYGSEIKAYLIAILGLVLLSIAAIIYLSQKTENDKKLTLLKEFSPESYLFILFNASLLFTILRVIFYLTINEVIFTAIAGFIYIVLLIYFSYNRAKDAQVNIVWLICAWVALVLFETLFILTGYTIFVFIVDCISLLHVVLIVLPSKPPRYLEKYKVPQNNATTILS